MLTPDSPAVTIEGLFLRSTRAAPRLRVGLLLPRRDLAAPSARIIGQLGACNFVDLIAAITAEPGSHVEASGAPTLYSLYRWLDQVAHAATARSLASQDCIALLGKLTPFTVGSDPVGVRLVLSRNQHDALVSCQLDVILALGSVPDPAELAKVARYGVWITKLGDPLLGDERSQVFWSTMQQLAPLCVSLEAHIAGRPAPATLSSGTLSLATRFSTIRNLLGPAHMGVGLIVSKLWQLHTSGWDYVLAQCSDAAVYRPSTRTLPTTWQMLAWISQSPVRQIRHRIRLRNTKAIWRVGIRLESRLDGLPSANATTNLSWIEALTGHYYADPFVYSHSGRSYLFVEDVDLTTHKGRISCLEIDQGGAPGPAQVALERPYHLSYPQVFSHDGDVFMIPESGFNNTVEIYRAVNFPTQWELARVLFRGPAFDTTVLRHADRFWFFVTLFDRRYPESTLLVLFYSDSPLGDWMLHPASPISADIRITRCAGSLFMDRGSWIRPTQDCRYTYGEAVHYQRIIDIDTRTYREEPAGTLTSQMIPGATGIHTYNRDGHLEVIDARSRVDLRDVVVNGAPRNPR
jgi:hypothetical protein